MPPDLARRELSAPRAGVHAERSETPVALSPAHQYADDSDGVRARAQALQHLSCWGASDPTSASARHRSSAGLLRRVLWAEHWKRDHDSAPTCAVCGRLWTPRTGDLHETVPTLASAVFTDLVPMCRAHHTDLHGNVRTTGAVLRLGYRVATQETLLRLRKRHADHLAP